MNSAGQGGKLAKRAISESCGGWLREQFRWRSFYAVGLGAAGLAVAAVMLPLITSARPANTSDLTTVPEEEPIRRGSVIAASPPQEETHRQGSVFAQLRLQAGLQRQGSVFAEFYAEPEPTLTPLPTFMPLPVAGIWQVTCGYGCGLHTAANSATFALDMVPVEGASVGQPVRSPVDGQISAVADSATFFCENEWRRGPEGGSAITIDFKDAGDGLWRLRLLHLDPATVGAHLRPGGEPVPVTAGAFLGNLAPLDGCSHLHLGLTRLEESREVPEPLVIAGSLPADCDSDSCREGAQLPPESH